MKCLKIFLTGITAFLFCSCWGDCSVESDNQKTNSGNKSQNPVSVVNWNLQTFFDANKDGCEYSEFLKSSDWNKEKYETRLERLSQVITSLDADIYVFEELENEGIIYDLSNTLSGSGQNWNQKKFWNYSVFVKEEGTAIGIGILSRYPLMDAKVHSMDIRIHKEAQPSVRYILQTSVSIHRHKITIFANHWKSKVGGQEKTEIWRDWQESILGKKIHELLSNPGDSEAVIICGDFNRDAQDFVCNFKSSSAYISEEKNTLLRFADFGYTDFTSAQSFWFSDSGANLYNTGSYVYEDEWEKIDNIMYAGNIKIIQSGPCAASPWSLAKDYPMAYKIYSGTGYSDHLPVMIKFILCTSDKI